MWRYIILNCSLIAFPPTGMFIVSFIVPVETYNFYVYSMFFLMPVHLVFCLPLLRSILQELIDTVEKSQSDIGKIGSNSIQAAKMISVVQRLKGFKKKMTWDLGIFSEFPTSILVAILYYYARHYFWTIWILIPFFQLSLIQFIDTSTRKSKEEKEATLTASKGSVPTSNIQSSKV